MPQKTKKPVQTGKTAANKPAVNMLLMAVCLVVAVIVIVFMVVQRSNLNQDKKNLTAELEASQAQWQSVSAEKEELQGELDATNDQLREAKTSLEESVAKTSELEGQVTELVASRDLLSEKLDAEMMTNNDLTVYIATTTDLLEAKEEFIATTTDLLKETQAENETLTAQLEEAQAVIDSSSDAIRTARKNQLATLQLYLQIREQEAAGTTDAAKKEAIEADMERIKTSIAEIEAQLAE